LFMIPADTGDIKKEYEILRNELIRYNPELIDKKRVLAITKSDMLDEELIEALRADLPDIPSVFISSITQMGITTLKDLLWKELNNQEFHDVESIVHRPIDIKSIVIENDFEEDFPEE